jgi:hypothetical protein
MTDDMRERVKKALNEVLGDVVARPERMEEAIAGREKLIMWLTEAAIEAMRDDVPIILSCPKCGLKGAAFICSTPGCPVNGGAAWGHQGDEPS